MGIRTLRTVNFQAEVPHISSPLEPCLHLSIEAHAFGKPFRTATIRPFQEAFKVLTNMIGSVPIGTCFRAVCTLSLQGRVAVAHEALSQVVNTVVHVTYASCSRIWILYSLIEALLDSTLEISRLAKFSLMEGSDQLKNVDFSNWPRLLTRQCI